MKKLLVLMALCVFMVTPALADEPIIGSANLLCMTVYQDDDVIPGEGPDSELIIELTTCTPQGPYILPATADGELLGGALWDSITDALPVNLGLLLTIQPGPPVSFGLAIDWAQTGTQCPGCPVP